MEERNYHLTTVGGISTLYGVSSGVAGLWLIVTGYLMPGAVCIVGAAGMLYVAARVFSRIRGRKTDWFEHSKKDRGE